MTCSARKREKLKEKVEGNSGFFSPQSGSFSFRGRHHTQREQPLQSHNVVVCSPTLTPIISITLEVFDRFCTSHYFGLQASSVFCIRLHTLQHRRNLRLVRIWKIVLVRGSYGDPSEQPIRSQLISKPKYTKELFPRFCTPRISSIRLYNQSLYRECPKHLGGLDEYRKSTVQ